MKKLAITLAAAASIFTLSACNNGGDSEVIVETEAGNITKEEFYNAMKERSGEQILKLMVEDKVLQDKYDVTDEEVNEELDKLKEQYGDQFEMVLQQSGYKNEDALKKDIRSNLLREKAMTEGVEITDEDVKDYYERMKTQVKASHILVDDEKTANEVIEKLNNGEKFEDLAKEYSKDPSGAKGGDLGFFGPGDMVPEFENAAYGLEVDQVTKEPVKSQFGYHIIKVTDKKPNEEADIKPFDEMKEQIRNTLLQQESNPEAVNELVEKAKVNVKDDDLKGAFENPKEQQ